MSGTGSGTGSDRRIGAPAAGGSAAGGGGADVLSAPLQRRNPVVKLALVLLVSTVLLAVLDPFTPAVLYLLALSAVAATAGLRPVELAAAHLPFAAFASGVLVVNVLAREDWRAGLAIGVSLALRTLVVGVLSIGFVASTDPVRLMTSLVQHARLSPRVAYAVLAGYRVLQDLPAQWALLRAAHAVRAPQRTGGRLPRSPRHLGGVVFGLLVASIRRAERVARSLEARGLGLQPRTTWHPVPLGRADAVMVVAVITILLVVLVLSAMAGTLRGPAALYG